MFSIGNKANSGAGITRNNVLFILFLLSAGIVFGQELTGIHVTEKIIIEFENGHGCMTQTRDESKEEAKYEVDKCGPVKYTIDKKGKRFTVFEKKDKKWFVWKEYEVDKSFSDLNQGSKRYSFYMKDGSMILYVPVSETGPLIILDLAGEDVIHYIYQ